MYVYVSALYLHVYRYVCHVITQYLVHFHACRGCRPPSSAALPSPSFVFIGGGFRSRAGWSGAPPWS